MEIPATPDPARLRLQGREGPRRGDAPRHRLQAGRSRHGLRPAPPVWAADIATLRIDFMGSGDSTASSGVTTTPPPSLTPRRRGLPGRPGNCGRQREPGRHGLEPGGGPTPCWPQRPTRHLPGCCHLVRRPGLNGASCLRVPALRMPMPRPKRGLFTMTFDWREPCGAG